MKKKVIIIISIVVGVLLIGGGIFAYFTFRPPTQEEISRYESVLAEGDLLMDAHEYSEAVSKYNDSLKIVHTDMRAYSKIVDIYLSKNDFEKALEVAQKAQNRINSTQAGLIYADIGEAYFDTGDYYNSRINYEIAGSLSNTPAVNLGLSKSYVYNNEFDLAKKLLSKEYGDQTVDDAKLLYAYILGTEDTNSSLEFVQAYTVSNTEMSSYFDEYKSVLESLNDDELFNITKLSRVYLNSNYPTLAIRLLEPKSDDIKQYVDALYFLGKAYLNTKQYDKSIETLLRASSLLGYESDKYWMLSRAYFKKDDLVNTITYYDMAVGYAGDDLSRNLIEEYLNILLDSNQISKAKEVYSSVVEDIDKAWLYLIGLDLYYNENDSKFEYYLNKLSSMEMTDDQKKEYLFWKIRKNLDVGDDTSLKNINQDFDTLLSLDRFNPKYYWLKGSYALLISDSSVAKSNFELALEYDLQGEVTNEVEDLLAQLE